MRRSDLISLVAALACAGAAAGAGAPHRVVSLNLCTDQLAFLLADPGQLLSVSRLAHDPRSAALAAQMADLPANSGAAEEVVLMDPDLILAGTWTTRATVQMLTDLGFRVELFAPVNSLDEARANITRMGALLGQPDRAAALLAAFDARRDALGETPGRRPRVALYYALGNTAGRATLPGDLLAAAGLDNIAEARGLPYGGHLSLEELLLENPDLILIGRPYGGHARATELLAHPALRASGKLRMIDDGAAWVCELPALLDAVADLVALRQAWEADQ